MIYDDGVRAIGKMLTKNRKLTELNLRIFIWQNERIKLFRE